MKNKRKTAERQTVDKLTFVWWSERWAANDRTRRRRRKSIPFVDMKGWINKTLEKSVEARFLFLKDDLIMRIKSLIVRDERLKDLRRLGKRIGKIRREFGDAQGREIIVQAVRVVEIDLFKDGMTCRDISKKLEKLVKKMGQPPVF